MRGRIMFLHQLTAILIPASCFARSGSPPPSTSSLRLTHAVKEEVKQVIITLENRNKRKYTTSVEGLAQYGI